MLLAISPRCNNNRAMRSTNETRKGFGMNKSSAAIRGTSRKTKKECKTGSSVVRPISADLISRGTRVYTRIILIRKNRRKSEFETFTPIFIEYWPDWRPSSRQYNIIYNSLLHLAAYTILF